MYLQVIMDNFSRYIINYKITESIGALSTVETIKDAEKKLNNYYNDRNLMMDGGPENVNRHVEKLLIAKNINRVIAKVDMRFSNSMIESLFRSMKNNYLYYQKIRSLSKFKMKVKYYVKEHNLNIPHSAFKGATPNEVYFDKWSIKDEQELKDKIANRVKERQKRVF
ncbi:integrase core domain-containing protein [Halobacteriovorax sp. CON-3]|uniref:integrase core domain-containing protein n=1 Tax=Halobacteriovorax sp. CON-3 TaxID=3157710 RepID=UPI003718A24A